MKCFMIKGKIWNEDGSPNPKTAMETLSLVSEADQLIIMNMGRPCLKFKTKDLCERAFLLHKCMKEKDPVVSWKCKLYSFNEFLVFSIVFFSTTLYCK